MDFQRLQFNKKDRYPVTDTSTQISALEWNALGQKVRELDGIRISFDECPWDKNEYGEYPIE